MNHRRFNIYMHRESFANGIAVAFYDDQTISPTLGGNNQLFVAKPIEFHAVEADMLHDPAVRMTDAQAQQMFDQLWLLGFRPHQGDQNASSAMKDHLADLRKILFKKMGIEDDDS